jgi:hypothetical protein
VLEEVIDLEALLFELLLLLLLLLLLVIVVVTVAVWFRSCSNCLKYAWHTFT